MGIAYYWCGECGIVHCSEDGPVYEAHYNSPHTRIVTTTEALYRSRPGGEWDELRRQAAKEMGRRLDDEIKGRGTEYVQWSDGTGDNLTAKDIARVRAMMDDDNGHIHFEHKVDYNRPLGAWKPSVVPASLEAWCHDD